LKNLARPYNTGGWRPGFPYPTQLHSPASSYLAFAVLVRLAALLLVVVVAFFVVDVRVEVFFVVDGRVGVLLLLTLVGLTVTDSSAAGDAATFFLVVFVSAGAAVTFSFDGDVFLRVARDVLPS
jgi:hypothetical protein